MDDKQTDISQKIINWLGKSPRWYSQALRLAVLGDDVSKADIDALACSAAEEQGVHLKLVTNNNLPSITQEEVEALCHMGRGVLLESISDTHSVNNIHQGEKLEFATRGLTLIYGNNGSGKTGYSRVLRNVCSSRGGVPEVLPNVFAKGADTPSAVVTAAVDGVQEKVEWSAGKRDNVTFPEVSVFDRECSQIEVTKEHEISYAPFYFIALESLVEIVESTRQRIEDIIAGEESKAIFPTTNDQEANKLLDEVRGLLDISAVDDWLSSQELTEGEHTRLEEIPGLLAALPEKEIPGLRRRKKQLEGIRIALGAYLKACTADSIEAYHEALDSVAASQSAVDLAARQLDDATYLEGVGSSTWRALWRAAKDYSEKTAYRGMTFPNIGDDARCPLCQQKLAPEAAKRFITFDTFIKGATATQLDECKNKVESFESNYEDSRFALINVKASIGSVADDATRDTLDVFITKLEGSDSRFYESEDVANASEYLVPCIGKLVKEEQAINDKVTAISGAVEPEVAGKLSAERASLAAREWISSNRPSIMSAMAHSIAAHDARHVSTKISSRAISRFVGELAKSEINDAYKLAFKQELAFFFKRDPRVQMTTKTSKGSTIAGLGLAGTDAKVRLSNVFSEGELKVLSLAGFFANLSLQQQVASVVFDDPVTSLDHLWRKVVAQRISVEAKNRPIIIFTHDPAFALELTAEADSLNVPVTTRYISKWGKTSGFVTDELPWEVIKTSKRVKSLKNTAQELKKLEKNNPPEFERRIQFEYSRLRSLWERAVEEVLLGGVVERYGPAIHTQQLRGLDTITKADIDAVNAAMTKCSGITEAHDNPSIPLGPLPDADEFEQDVLFLETWVNDIRKRPGRK